MSTMSVLYKKINKKKSSQVQYVFTSQQVAHMFTLSMLLLRFCYLKWLNVKLNMIFFSVIIMFCQFIFFFSISLQIILILLQF